MAKIVLLMPCLMLDNNREANRKSQKLAMEHYIKGCGIDHFVICDQCFKEDDYIPGVEYIGHHPEKMGFIVPRNELLKWFYNSDYDYAVWMDGNKYVSPATLNDFATVVDAVKFDSIKEDFILSTIGINVSAHRINYHKQPDYFDIAHVIRVDKGYLWFHGMFMKNIKKYYNDEIYIPSTCDVWAGTNEDIWFVLRVRETYKTYLCPTITINCPSSKSSTWMSGNKGYDYPTVQYGLLRKMAKEDAAGKPKHFDTPDANYILARVDYMKDTLKDFKPRKKKEVVPSDEN